ncbi:receptor-like protein EIX2 [Ziziphus jujuba]|uniref:Receptor-like protein EIX2 n=1 Tax=Ziziphus jujuba TaxID=326968 RepID=A0ABM3ZS16_ZIZJJ|nr:receptor-like protein EIX2 [Ziziphus jujuba]
MGKSINIHFYQPLSLLILSGIRFLSKICFCFGDLDVVCIDDERKALFLFKDGLTDPSGRLSPWVGEDCGKWEGVSCNNGTGHVVELKLRNCFPDGLDGGATVTSLGGKIDPSLLVLKDLNFLDISMNDFGGSQIPSFIGSLQNLRYLNLSGACFGGTISPSLGNLSRVYYLDLNNNHFIQSNKSSITWLSEYWWTYMRADSEVLDEVRRLSEAGKLKIPVEKTFPIAQLEIQEAKEKLDGKDADYEAMMSYKLSIAKKVFSQEKDMILNSKIPLILELHLPNCQLFDPPLTFPFLNFTSLSVLDLSNNGFKSTIPDWLFNLKSLVKLDLSNNHFHGEIPDAISNLAFLEKLDLSGIHWGKLSRNLGKLCNLELYDSKISGEIVDSFDSLSECFSNRLETLDLGDNGVMGKLPNSLGYIESLRFLQLSNNSLQGSLPCSIGNLKSLQKILLGDNRMSIIPKNLGQLSKLVVLDISENI